MEFKSKINDYLVSLMIVNKENTLEELKKLTPFSLCLKVFRNEKRISQRELAETIGISENSIYNYENEKSNPTKNNKRKIMDYLDITEEYLEYADYRIMLDIAKLELTEKNHKENENILNRIKKEISSFEPSPIDNITFDENLFRSVILPMVLNRKEFSLSELENIILGFKMLNANKNYKIELAFPDIPNGLTGWKILLFDKRNNLYCKEYEIIEFADKVLLSLSEKLNDIFKEDEKEAQRKINKNSAELSKQYEDIYRYWNEISTEIDKKQSIERDYFLNNKKDLKELSNKDLTNMIKNTLDDEETLSSEEIDKIHPLITELENRTFNMLNKKNSIEKKKIEQNKEGGADE